MGFFIGSRREKVPQLLLVEAFDARLNDIAQRLASTGVTDYC
jgi:hypothetical protein